MVEAGKTDRYGRSLGKVLVGGVDANLEPAPADKRSLLKTGWPMHRLKLAHGLAGPYGL